MKYFCNYIPCTINYDENGKKSPSFQVSWRDYQDKKYTNFIPQNSDRAVICGAVSDNLCGLDFDDHKGEGNVFEEFKSKLSQSILDKVVIETTPTNGVHVYFRSALFTAKKDLAFDQDKDAIIELKAGGNLMFCAPSKKYTLANHKLIEDAEYLTDEEAFEIVTTASSFNKYVAPKEPTLNIMKSGNAFSLLSDFGCSQAEALRSEAGREWCKQVLYNAGWRPSRQTVDENGNACEGFSHPGASNPKDIHLVVYVDHVTNFSACGSKNGNVETGTDSFYNTILNVGFNGDTKAMSREFYQRFPQYNNRLAYENTDFLADFKEITKGMDDYFDQPEEGNTFKEKDELLDEILSDSNYGVLSGHINNSCRHSTAKMPFGYLLSGLALIGGCSYRNFYTMAYRNAPNDVNKHHAETTICTCFAAPQGSGKNNVKNSFSIYAEAISDFGAGKKVGKKLFETRIDQLPIDSGRAIQKKFMPGSKNMMFYCDEYQDVLRVKGSNDVNRGKCFSVIKQLITKTEKTMAIEDSIAFGKEVQEMEKAFGEIDYSWWRMSQFNLGTMSMYGALGQEDEEGGFARRYLWFNERQTKKTRVDMNSATPNMEMDASFRDFLLELLNVRSQDNGSSRANYPVIEIVWNNDANDLFNDKLEENDEYLETGKFGNCPLRYSYLDMVARLSYIFAIARGEWRRFDGDCVETTGDAFAIESFGDGVYNSSITVNKKDVEYAWRLFNISCFDFCYGIKSAVSVSSEERNDARFEQQLVSFIKKKKAISFNKISEAFPDRSQKSLIKTLTDLCAGQTIFKKPNTSIYYSPSEWVKYLEKQAKNNQ